MKPLNMPKFSKSTNDAVIVPRILEMDLTVESLHNFVDCVLCSILTDPVIFRLETTELKLIMVREFEHT